MKMAAGIASGLTVHATLAVAGMAVAFQQFPILRVILQWAAAAYLLWLAKGMITESFVAWYSGALYEVQLVESRHSPFVRGLLCNLFNPKVALFLAAVCAPFLMGTRPGWWPYAVWAVIVGLGLGLWSVWAVLLQWSPLRSRYERAAGLLDGVFGVLLAALAVRLMIG